MFACSSLLYFCHFDLILQFVLSFNVCFLDLLDLYPKMDPVVLLVHIFKNFCAFSLSFSSVVFFVFSDSMLPVLLYYLSLYVLFII